MLKKGMYREKNVDLEDSLLKQSLKRTVNNRQVISEKQNCIKQNLGFFKRGKLGSGCSLLIKEKIQKISESKYFNRINIFQNDTQTHKRIERKKSFQNQKFNAKGMHLASIF